MSKIAVIALLLGAGLPGAVQPTAVDSRSDGKRMTSAAGIRAAQKFARSRQGTVAFAVLDTRSNRVRGLRRTVRFYSASVAKAMLLVSVLRRAGKRPLTQSERNLLWPMVTRSDNDAASAVYGQIGDIGLRRVARAAGMRKFSPSPVWGTSQITAADQARFFLRIDKLVPRAHRRYAHGSLFHHNGATLGHRSRRAAQAAESLVQRRMGSRHHAPGRACGAQAGRPPHRARGPHPGRALDGLWRGDDRAHRGTRAALSSKSLVRRGFFVIN